MPAGLRTTNPAPGQRAKWPVLSVEPTPVVSRLVDVLSHRCLRQRGLVIHLRHEAVISAASLRTLQCRDCGHRPESHKDLSRANGTSNNPSSGCERHESKAPC